MHLVAENWSLCAASSEAAASLASMCPASLEAAHMKDKINGLLVRVQNASELAQAMEMMILNPEMRQKLGQEMRVVIFKGYDSKIIAAKMLNYYR